MFNNCHLGWIWNKQLSFVFFGLFLRYLYVFKPQLYTVQQKSTEYLFIIHLFFWGFEILFRSNCRYVLKWGQICWIWWLIGKFLLLNLIRIEVLWNCSLSLVLHSDVSKETSLRCYFWRKFSFSATSRARSAYNFKEILYLGFSTEF